MSMPRSTTTRRLVFAAAAVTAALSLAAPASAKEIASGGTPVSSTCSPVSNLKAQGDARAGETGLATIDVDYDVKPCNSKQAVTVETTVAESFNPSVVVWDDTAAPESGRFTVSGVKLRTTYKVTVIVRDAATGSTLGTASVSAAAVPKGV
jgi:hypothetical protein